jgi:hypothetical protein
MAIEVEIAETLKDEVMRKFKEESKEIFKLMYSLKDNPNKGKPLGNVGGILIKELKYESFRFYFITDGHKLRLMNEAKVIDILIRFVRMSDKKAQQKTIDEIKNVLRKIGEEGF